MELPGRFWFGALAESPLKRQTLAGWRMSMGIDVFESLPYRVFLDSCTLQAIREYGPLIWENESIDTSNPLGAYDPY